LNHRIIEKASKKEKILGLDTHQGKNGLAICCTKTDTTKCGPKKEVSRRLNPRLPLVYKRHDISRLFVLARHWDRAKNADSSV